MKTCLILSSETDLTSNYLQDLLILSNFDVIRINTCDLLYDLEFNFTENAYKLTFLIEGNFSNKLIFELSKISTFIFRNGWITFHPDFLKTNISMPKFLKDYTFKHLESIKK